MQIAPPSAPYYLNYLHQYPAVASASVEIFAGEFHTSRWVSWLYDVVETRRLAKLLLLFQAVMSCCWIDLSFHDDRSVRYLRIWAEGSDDKAAKIQTPLSKFVAQVGKGCRTFPAWYVSCWLSLHAILKWKHDSCAVSTMRALESAA